MDVRRVRGAGEVGLAVGVSGDPAAPPVVLLAALGETRNSWDPVLAGLAARFRVYALELRGHGDSDWPGVYSNALMAADVQAAVDDLGLSRFRLVGHSLGGAVALLVAEQLGPRVTRLVLEDAVPPYPRERRPTPERPDAELPFDWAVVDAAYAEMSDPEMRRWPGLSSITAPTLIVGGGPTSHVPGERIEAAARLIPDCAVVTIDVGHHIHTEAPQAFLDAVLPVLLGGADRG